MTNKMPRLCRPEELRHYWVNVPQGLYRDLDNPNYPWDHILGSGNAHRIRACVRK